MTQTLSQPMLQTGILDLVSQSGFMVKLVLFALVAASVLCWAIILTKSREVRMALRKNKVFLDLFWNSKNLEEIYTKTEKMIRCPVANVFRAGYRELKKLNAGEKATIDAGLEVENIQRALARTLQTETGALEKYVSILATTASAAPFVGLFGTVWGIMNSFHSIGSSGSANLAVVAPGISEALIATAVGLAAAIPAVIAYNHFIGRIRKVTLDMDCFSNDLLNIIQRSFLSGKRKPSDD